MEATATSSNTINSRANAIKTILLAAWRGKLSNDEWECRIRKVLPRGVTGDVYDLADCLLKQALVGPVPNQLFISYLKHAVKCELVSHAAVLTSISNQSINLRPSVLHNRTSPIICLLEFLKSFRDQISCNGSEVECLNLCRSLSDHVHWLLKCINSTLDYMNGQLQDTNVAVVPSCIGSTATTTTNPTIPPQVSATPSITSSTMSTQQMTQSQTQHCTSLTIIDLCTDAISYFINKPFTKSLLFISKIEYGKDFDENILKHVQTIQQKLVSCQNRSVEVKIAVTKILNQLDKVFNSSEQHPSNVAAVQLQCLQMHRIRSTQVSSACNYERSQQQLSAHLNSSATNFALFNSLYPLIAFDAVLRPARPKVHLARQIVTMMNFNSAPAHITYSELIRVCLIGLIDAHGNSKAKASWSFFTFLKLPRLLIELNKLLKQQSDHHQVISFTSAFSSNHNVNFVKDISVAFERLCQYSPLLDEAEHKYNCDLFKCFVKELCKIDQGLIPLKNLDFRKLSTRRPININSKGAHMMLQTEQVVTSVLSTLKTEQNHSELFKLLRDQCSGISFEYTLSAAAATGRLHVFVERLIEHNELYKMPREGLASQKNLTQSLMFDITFLILIYIAQRYGPELIARNQQSTFNKWYYECYDPSTCFNCPKEMLKGCDDGVVSNLIKQLMDPGSDIQVVSVNWHEVCFNLPKAISEILSAWTQGVLTDEDMATVIERIRSKMCCLTVIAASWLRFHIKTLDEAKKMKPLSVLNCLSKASQQAKLKQGNPAIDSDIKNDGYAERSSLSGAVIKRIYFELMPNIPSNRASAHNGRVDHEDIVDESSYHSYRDRFISTLTTQDILVANVKQSLLRGWLDYDSLNSLNSLFKITGSERFADLIVELLLTSHESPSDLNRAVNVTFGLFHLDIEACAIALLNHIIPSWLLGEKRQAMLNQPKALALATLTVMALVEVNGNFKDRERDSARKEQEKQKFLTNGIKQNERQEITMNIDSVDATLVPPAAKRTKLMQEWSSSIVNDVRDTDSSDQLERLNMYTSELMRLFQEIMSDSVMSHRTLFPVLFLQQTVICAREDSHMITTHLEPEILLDMISLFSSELTFEVVLAISNLSTRTSRKFAAKAMCKLSQIKESKQKPHSLARLSAS